MQIKKKGNNLWLCYPTSTPEFTELSNLCRKHLGRSHWSIFVKTWCIRKLAQEEYDISSYPRVVEIRNRELAALVILKWG